MSWAALFQIPRKFLGKIIPTAYNAIFHILDWLCDQGKILQLNPFEFLPISSLQMVLKCNPFCWYYTDVRASKGTQRSLSIERPIQEDKSRQTDVSEWWACMKKVKSPFAYYCSTRKSGREVLPPEKLTSKKVKNFVRSLVKLSSHCVSGSNKWKRRLKSATVLYQKDLWS